MLPHPSPIQTHSHLEVSQGRHRPPDNRPHFEIFLFSAVKGAITASDTAPLQRSDVSSQVQLEVRGAEGESK